MEYLTYNQLIDIARKELNNVEDIKKYIADNNFNDGIIYRIRKGTDKTQYPNYIIKILNTFGYTVHREKYYKIDKT